MRSSSGAEGRGSIYVMKRNSDSEKCHKMEMEDKLLKMQNACYHKNNISNPTFNNTIHAHSLKI